MEGRIRQVPCSVRGALVVAMTLGFAAACGGGSGRAPGALPSPDASGSSPSPSVTSSTPSPTSTPSPSAGPTASGPADPSTLADRLERAARTVADPHATPDAVREAGETQQLAVRTLALGPPAVRRQVVSWLSPETARQTRDQLEAARLLSVLTEPRRRFPPWRILEPPPAKVLLGYYREAERRTGVPWTYLAAIHLVETRMGRIRGPSTAGALGPMQFMPATWARYGAGGDINDPHDAILAAARLLVDHGAPRDMATALWHYNPSEKYVGAVTAYARTMQRSPAAYRGYWSWQVFCQMRRGAYVLPVGYPQVRPVPLPGG